MEVECEMKWDEEEVNGEREEATKWEEEEKVNGERERGGDRGRVRGGGDDGDEEEKAKRERGRRKLIEREMMQ